MGTEGTAAAPAGAQGLLLGFMGSRCCRSTASAHSTCPLHQSSGSARRPSRLGRALAGGREQRKQIKAHKLAESDAFPYPGPELRKLRWVLVGRIPAVRGCWGRARGTPGLPYPVSPHLPGSATLPARGFCSSLAPQPVHDALLAPHPASA